MKLALLSRNYQNIFEDEEDFRTHQQDILDDRQNSSLYNEVHDYFSTKSGGVPFITYEGGVAHFMKRDLFPKFGQSGTPVRLYGIDATAVKYCRFGDSSI